MKRKMSRADQASGIAGIASDLHGSPAARNAVLIQAIVSVLTDSQRIAICEILDPTRPWHNWALPEDAE